MVRLTSSEAAALGMGIKKKKKAKQVNIKKEPFVQWDARVSSNGVWLQIPFPPPSLNIWRKWHWSKEWNYKNSLKENIRLLALGFKMPCFEKANVQIIHYFRTNHARDPQDNYAPKFIMDALVHAGILVDDNGRLVTVPTVKIKVDKERPRTEIFIQEGRGG